MNVVVICSDTFRYDHLGFLGKQPVHTPNLNNLASESAAFPDFWLCSFPTLLNRIEVFTGRCTFPLFNWGPLPYQFPVLAEVFKRHGFTTALLADTLHMMNDGWGYGRGVDFVRDVPGQMHDKFQPKSTPMVDLPCPIEKLGATRRRLDRYRRNAYWYRQRDSNTTATLFQAAMEWLDQPRDKFFMWIDAFDPHEPWDAPAEFLKPYPWNKNGDAVFWPKAGYANEYPAADIENMRSLYRAEVTQTDHWIGAFLSQLRGKGLLDNTAVIFTSDHGTYFGEHGLLGIQVQATSTLGDLGLSSGSLCLEARLRSIWPVSRACCGRRGTRWCHGCGANQARRNSLLAVISRIRDESIASASGRRNGRLCIRRPKVLRKPSFIMCQRIRHTRGM